MAALRACPFCRNLFTGDEAKDCPECGVALVAMSALPPSQEALQEAAEQGEIVLPEERPLPIGYFGRGRGALIGLSLLGIGGFFLPWVELRMPEEVIYSAFDLARGRAGFLWGGVTAWLVMIPLVLTRRTVKSMRGVRVVCALFAAMTLSEAVMLVLLPPRRALAPLDFSFSYGLYVSALISLSAVAVSARFGGSLENLPRFLLERFASEDEARTETSDGKTLH